MHCQIEESLSSLHRIKWDFHMQSMGWKKRKIKVIEGEKRLTDLRIFQNRIWEVHLWCVRENHSNSFFFLSNLLLFFVEFYCIKNNKILVKISINGFNLSLRFNGWTKILNFKNMKSNVSFLLWNQNYKLNKIKESKL